MMKNFLVTGRNAHVAHVNPLLAILAALSSYPCIVPLFILDVFLWQFQNIYFRIMEIPTLERKKFVVLDRYKLPKLTL